MQIRDRIKDFRRVPASSLLPHPRNWRLHSQAQHDAMRGALAEIGYADALIARQLADGSLQLLDGHLRAEVTPDALVPVLIVEVGDDEALKLLVTLDPLAAMAHSNEQALRGLIDEVQFDSESLRRLLDSLCDEALSAEGSERALGDAMLPTSYQIVVQCDGEEQQRALYERLTREGWRCRVLAL